MARKKAALGQLAFGFAPSSALVLATAEPKRGRRKKKKPSQAQQWARLVFRTDFSELTNGKHQATGCGCILVVSGSRGRWAGLQRCVVHRESGSGFPRFDLPPYQVAAALAAAGERAAYFSLPVEPLPPALKKALMQVAAVWETEWGDPRQYTRFTPGPCGCVFEPHRVEMKGKGLYPNQETRKGFYWFAIRVRSCGQEGFRCNFPHLLLEPDVAATIRQYRKALRAKAKKADALEA